jgi:hypothetical protein
VGKIQALFVNVEGDNETLRDALHMAGNLIGQIPSATVELLAPVDAPALLPAAAPAAPANVAAGKFHCKQCPESFDSVGKIAAHTRMKHPKAPKPAAVETPKPDEVKGGAAAKGLFWCPAKNCAASFSKEGWRKQHAQRAHGITL